MALERDSSIFPLDLLPGLVGLLVQSLLPRCAYLSHYASSPGGLLGVTVAIVGGAE